MNAPRKEIEPLADVEAREIKRALAICEGDKPLAALALGISLRTLQRKLHDQEILCVRQNRTAQTATDRL